MIITVEWDRISEGRSDQTKYTLSDLRVIASAMGISPLGTKVVLAQRILDHQPSEQDEEYHLSVFKRIEEVVPEQPTLIEIIQERSKSHIQKLRESAPELFVQGYARLCQTGYQSTMITADEVEY